MQKIFIKRLIELMEEKDMTQCELANLIGTTNVTISRYITGDRKPRIEIIAKIAEVFNVSIDYLLGLSNNRFINSSSNDTGFSKIEYKLNELGLLDCDKKLSDAQIQLIQKLIEANKDFINNLKDKNSLA
ncbi:MAG: helix-turn-helix transcriptional regulator [Clostridia bacterium]|nr:helix-turn-helix transcriptional regulator [Clostridia bacterium]